MKRKTFQKIITICLAVFMLFGVIDGGSKPVLANELPETESYGVTDTYGAQLAAAGKTNEELFTDLKKDLTESGCQILNHVDAAAFAEAGHIARVPEEEKLDTYVFLDRNGYRTVYYMGENVKFIDEKGAVKEKDITLVNHGTGYRTKQNNIQVDIPNNPAFGIAVEYAGYELSIVPQGRTLRSSHTLENNAVTYTNYFGSGIDLRYTPDYSGVKEDVILKAYTGVNSFSFILNTDGLLLNEEDGRYFLASPYGMEILDLGSVLVYDAMGRPDEGYMEVSTITEGQKYRVTIGADKTFLIDPQTVYPVTIDPTLTISDNTHGANAIEDAPIFENKPSSNFGAYTYNRVGYAGTDYGKARTVMRLSGLLNDPVYQAATAASFASAYLYLKESSGTSTVKVEIYPIQSNPSWTETNVTWNSFNFSQEKTGPSTSANLVSNTWTSISITSFIEKWKAGEFNANAGLIFFSSNETSVNKSFCSSEFGTTTNRPYLVVTYRAVNLKVVYDNAYLSRHSDAVSRINSQVTTLHNQILSSVGLFVNPSSPTKFSSYADVNCPKAYNLSCTCVPNSSCIDSAAGALQTYHHKNISTILLNITPPSSGTKKVAYIGHRVCTASNHNEEMKGMAYHDGGIAAVANHGTITDETRTFIHEFGHLIGANDHYGANNGTGPTTQSKNEELNIPEENWPFSSYCIYGEYKESVTDYTICQGCKEEIRNYIRTNLS